MSQSGAKKMQRILIANRGEIAVRIIYALREMGLESVTVYSDADHDSEHRYLADFAVRLPGVSSAETYLDMDKLLDAAKRTKADGIHPGYGFLSESDVFAETVTKAGLKFIGPDVASMRLMGNKISARNLMIKNKVPVVPGSEGSLKSVQELKDLTAKIGYPVILKAASGGGGRGMRVVRQDSELEAAFTTCTREATDYFANPEVFCERYIEHPRHIEFQVLFDEHGNGVHLFERDCSIQRRHQKLIEEAPSCYLNEEHRARLGEIAVRAGKAAGYQGAGTVEFICESPDRAYFMEMNTRIQVEHPITEMITGVDLIKSQINVAQGHPLPMKQEDIQIHGWAMETRINAEDAKKGFMPSPGKITRLKLPTGPFVRVDTHIKSGYEIPSHYDSMIAKVITWGKDRPEAMARMQRALSDLQTEGVTTTAPFHEVLLKNEVFRSGEFTTSFLVDHHDAVMEGLEQIADDDAAALLAAVAVAAKASRTPITEGDSRPLWTKRAREEGMERL
jgi:acetyl-CoA carboxylase biotin carboxylase subunit